MKVQLKEPNRMKWYPVRSGNDLTILKRWITWAKNHYTNPKFIIVNLYKQRMKDKKYKEYWKARYSNPLNLETKYMVYTRNEE